MTLDSGYFLGNPVCMGLGAWRNGWDIVFGWRTFFDLCLIYS